LELLITPKTVLILRIGFLYFVAREFYLTQFKEKKNKFIWFSIVFIFGYYGYAVYLAYRRRLIVRRKFNPKFYPRT
jgi:hypothetical protein